MSPVPEDSAEVPGSCLRLSETLGTSLPPSLLTPEPLSVSAACVFPQVPSMVDTTGGLPNTMTAQISLRVPPSHPRVQGHTLASQSQLARGILSSLAALERSVWHVLIYSPSPPLCQSPASHQLLLARDSVRPGP